MNKDATKFISEVVKPWEVINVELGKPFSLNPEINDFITKANALSLSIKHLPEALNKMKPSELIKESFSYKVISDLADSLKHGELRNTKRTCKLTVSSMFERNSEAKVRFLRSRISINHSTYGKIDFMQCSMESAIFISKKMNIKTNWSPKIFNNSGNFSDEIKVHASMNNQVIWTGMALEIVQTNNKGEYENVDLNGQVRFTLTSEF